LWAGSFVSGSVVASGFLVWIDPGWRQELWSPVGGHDHLPAAVVDDPVVISAQQDHIVQVCPTAVGPVDDVMGDAPHQPFGVERLFARGERRPWASCSLGISVSGHG